MSAFGKVGDFWTGTLTQLQGLGTDDGLAVGDPAWDMTNARMVHCATAAAGSSTWKHRTYDKIHLSWWRNTVDARYLPFRVGTSGGHPTITTEHVAMTLPADMAILDCRYFCTGAAGSTILSVHKNETASALATDTVVVSASTLAQFDLTGASFDKNDRLHINSDPAAAELAAHITLAVQYDWD